MCVNALPDTPYQGLTSANPKSPSPLLLPPPLESGHPLIEGTWVGGVSQSFRIGETPKEVQTGLERKKQTAALEKVAMPHRGTGRESEADSRGGGYGGGEGAGLAPLGVGSLFCFPQELGSTAHRQVSNACSRAELTNPRGACQ